MRLSDFTYDLPEERIAQFPPEQRGTTRLLVLDKQTGSISHHKYSDLPDLLEPGDVVVLNDTKVIKARLVATNSQGTIRELLLLEDHHTLEQYRRKVLYRGKLHSGEELRVQATPIIVEEVLDGGIAIISSTAPLLELAEHIGTVPLPPYMHREATTVDTERYQTVFARTPGSVAAPTASLNFTEDLAERLKNKGIELAYVTLHVGLGTFLPIRTDDVEGHTMHSEYFEVPATTSEIIKSAKHNGDRIVAIGTTVSRTLEFCAEQILGGSKQDLSGEANIFIYPGYKFKIIDVLLTNFHAPKSTVLMMAAALSGWDHLNTAYQEAIKKEYMFLSYGDSMFIA